MILPGWTIVRPVDNEHKDCHMLRMAIEYLPESEPGARYLLIAYGHKGKTERTAAYTSLKELLGALRAAGISLQREEEDSLLRDDESEQHYVLVTSKVELHDSHCFALHLRRAEKEEYS